MTITPDARVSPDVTAQIVAVIRRLEELAGQRQYTDYRDYYE